MAKAELDFSKYLNTPATIFWTCFAIGMTALGLWLGFSDHDWALSLVFSGLGLLTLAGYLSDPLLKIHGKEVARNLETFGLLPKPSETYLFVISLGILGLLLFEDIWRDMWWLLAEDKKGNVIYIYGYAILGISYSIYYAFSQYQKTSFEVAVLKYYTAIISAALAVGTAVYAYQTSADGYYILTAWNAIQAFTVLTLSGGKYVGEYIRLPSKDATRIELICGAIIVAAVLFIEKIVFNAYWAVALSTILVVWGMAEIIFKNYPILTRDSPPLGVKPDAETLAMSEKIEKQAFKAIYLIAIFGLLIYLGYSVASNVGAALGAFVGLVFAAWYTSDHQS